jgi:hypothetical protein
MFKLETIVALLAELLRSLLVEAVSGRVREMRFPHRLHGMKDVRRHVHWRTRRKLFNRLSTA